ncbi:MAG: SGNH/GDSL hydrolase family protein [Candidatus Magasanikiibacteriota bacterium]
MNKRNKIILLVLVVAFTGIYLNRAYAHFYNHIGEVNLASHVFDYQDGLLIGPDKGIFVDYVALGDSLTYGVGASKIENTWPYLLANNLFLDANKSFKLYNLGIPGAKIQDVIDYQLDQTIALSPDYITVFIGTNDTHDLVRPQVFASDLAYLTERLTKETTAKIVIINLPYLGSKNLVLFPYNYLLDWWTKQYNQEIENVAKHYNVELVDLYSYTKRELKTDQSFYSADLFHPSDVGYKLWADYFRLH